MRLEYDLALKDGEATRPKGHVVSGKRKRLSVVVPCYNEERGLAELLRRLSPVCRECVGHDYEIILVNDGSSDETWPEIIRLSKTYSEIVGVNMARNYGHQLALTAGLTMAKGDRIFIVDADLQDPPELLSDMMARLNAGADVAFGRRMERNGETRFKLVTASLFYRLLNRLSDAQIPADTGDFRLISRRVLDVLLDMPEQHRFVRGMVAWIGFHQVEVPYRRDARFAGNSNYPFKKMLKFAVDAITSFSVAPLRFSLYLGMGSVVTAFVLSLFAVWSWIEKDTTPGWASLAIIILVFGAMQMFCLAIIGEYLGRIYMQSKQRPLFVVESVHLDAAKFQENDASHGK